VEYQGRFIHVAGWATRFLFTPDQLNIPLRRLSGGEQSRVLIARLMLREADILLLDEPTNDLDIASLEVLENSMQEFAGALVLVTHDRYLLDRVSKQLLSLDGKGNARFFADLSQWENSVEESPEPQPEPEIKAPEKTAAGLSREEKKELAALEISIQKAEKEKAAAEAALADPAIATNSTELTERNKKLNQIETKIAALTAQWEKLESRR
jgi:ATP-binding cassette subfamily F protein uup